MFINLIHVTISILRFCQALQNFVLNALWLFCLFTYLIIAPVLFGGFCEALSNLVLKSVTQTKFNFVAIKLCLTSSYIF